MADSVAIYDPTNIAQPSNAISFTPTAIAHIKKDIQKHQALGLRLGVKKAGCSGLKYTIDYVYEINQDDVKQNIQDDLLVFISKESLAVFNGVSIDYVKEGINGRLKFINPNEKGSCGCGESFAV